MYENYIVSSNKVSYQNYTDDTGLYITMLPSEYKPIQTMQRTNQCMNVP